MHPPSETFSLRRTYEVGDIVYTEVRIIGQEDTSIGVECTIRFKFTPSHHTYESYVLEVNGGTYPEMVVRDALCMSASQKEAFKAWTANG